MSFGIKKFSSNAKGAALLLLSSASSSALGYAFLTLLAKKMSVADFGAFRLLVETSATIFPFAAFGFQYTCTKKIINSNPSERRRVKAAALVLMILIGTAVAVATFVLTEFLPQSLLGVYSALGCFSFIVFSTIFKEFVNNILPAEKAIVLQAAHVVLPQIILFLVVFFVADKFSITYVVSTVVLITVLSSSSLLFVSGLDLKKFGSALIDLIEDNRKIGLPIYTASYVSIGGLMVYQLMAGVHLTMKEYANLSMSIALTGIVTMISTSVIMVKISEFAKEERISRQVILGTLFSMIFASTVTIVAAWIVTTQFLSSEYEKVLNYLPLLIVASFLDGLSYIYNRFFLAKNLVRTLSRISMLSGLTILVLALILIPIYGIAGVILTKMTTALITFSLNLKAYLKRDGYATDL